MLMLYIRKKCAKKMCQGNVSEKPEQFLLNAIIQSAAANEKNLERQGCKPGYKLNRKRLTQIKKHIYLFPFLCPELFNIRRLTLSRLRRPWAAIDLGPHLKAEFKNDMI